MLEGAVRNDFRLDIAKFLIPFAFSNTGNDLIYLTAFLNMEKLCVCVCVCKNSRHRHGHSFIVELHKYSWPTPFPINLLVHMLYIS